MGISLFLLIVPALVVIFFFMRFCKLPTLRSTSVAGIRIIFLALFFIIPALTGCNKKVGIPYSAQEYALGTLCRITLYDRVFRDLPKQCFLEVNRIENLMSLSIEGSDVSNINKGSGISPVEVSRDTLDVIKTALDFSRITDGCFDISIGPLISLWGISSDDPHVPEKTGILELLPLVDYSRVGLQNSAVYLENAGMSIDLGGIAKGYAVDAVASFLRKAGVTRALLDFGGNIYALGEKSEGVLWRLGIQNPYSSRGVSIGYIPLKETSMVTSGKYERYFIHDGTRYHHIIDPETGYPSENGIESVTIISPSSTKADALSTGILVAGLDRGLAILNRFDDVEGVIIMSDKRVYLTEGLKNLFVLTDGDFQTVE